MRESNKFTVAITGDVMLGRLVNRVLGLDNFSYVWGNTINFLKNADLTLINLECVISSKGKPQPKFFNFRAHPDATKVPKSAGVDFVSNANNHATDFGNEALLEMVKILDRNKIAHSGAGKNRTEAIRHAVVKKGNLKIGIIALTDNEPEYEATASEPGVNYIPISLEEPYFSRLKTAIEIAKREADLVFVSAHVGPHYRTNPAREFVKFARTIIDFGVDVYWGTSNHVPQGIEIYKNKVILYDTGDFVDDYAVDRYEYFANDESFLFLLTVTKSRIEKIELIPVKIDRMQVNLAEEKEAQQICKNIQILCKKLGTKTEIEKNRVFIDVERQ